MKDTAGKKELSKASEVIYLGPAILLANVDYGDEHNPVITLEIGEGRMLDVATIKLLADDLNSFVNYLNEKNASGKVETK